MDLAGLESFVIYAAIGTLAVLGLFAIVLMPWNHRVPQRTLNRLKDLPPILSLGLFLALILIGLVIDNAADAIDEGLDDSKMKGVILRSDSALRTEVLFTLDDGAVEPTALARELAACNAFDRFAGPLGPKIQRQILDGVISAPPDDRENAADALYYSAKSRVYREDTYMEDMQRIYRNISAMRSLAILSLALIAIILPAVLLLILHGILHLSLHIPLARRLLGIARSLPRPLLKPTAIAFMILAVTFILSRWCFGLEEKDFNKRAYGYFASLMITADIHEEDPWPRRSSLPELSAYTIATTSPAVAPHCSTVPVLSTARSHAR